MAKKRRMMVATPMEWVEPPVTKEDAGEPEYSGWPSTRTPNSGHPHGNLYPDGFDGGQESPDNIDIDRMVFPHSESTSERESRERSARRQNEAMAFRDKAFQRSRNFDIRQGSVTGKDPGPPGLFDED